MVSTSPPSQDTVCALRDKVGSAAGLLRYGFSRSSHLWAFQMACRVTDQINTTPSESSKLVRKLEFWICYRKSAMGMGIFGGEFIRDQMRFSLAIGGTYCAVREVVKVRQTM